jgi:activator of HSP90 ATPase
MAFDFTLCAVIPAKPQEVYDAWLDSKGHSAMTGGKAKASPREGAAFTAWDGYISGRTLELEPGRRIVQSWRSSKFAKTDPDSRIEILLEPVKGGTKLILHHTEVPDGHTSYRDGGWQSNYFEPMKKYFGKGK